MSTPKAVFTIIGMLMLHASLLAQYNKLYYNRMKEVEHDVVFAVANNRTYTLAQNIPHIKLRYNIYLDKFEFLKDGTSCQIGNEKAIEHLLQVNKDFMFQPFLTSRDKLKEGFLVRLLAGSCTISKPYQVKFFDREPPMSSFHDPKPPRFEMQDSGYYIHFTDQPHPRSISSLRCNKVLDHFDIHRAGLKKYVREQNFRLKDEKALIRLMRHYNDT